MIPDFVIKHFSFTKGYPYQYSIEMHSKLELYFEEIRKKGIAIPTPEVDEVWHNFILHTRLYQEYCMTNFGKYIHHNPKLPKNIDNLIAAGITRDEFNNEKSICDNQCNGGAKCDNQCNGGNKCDNNCNGGSLSDLTTFSAQNYLEKTI